MSGILSMLLGAVSSVVTDAYFNLVTLLLPGNGTNGAQNNTFLDSSTNNFTITRNGNTTQGTFSPFSQTGWSGNFNTSTTYLTVTDTANLRFGSGNFTIEAWIYRSASGAVQTIASKGASTPTGWVFQISAADKLVFTDTSTSITGATSLVANTWYYVAVVRAGTGTNQTTLFVNAVSDATGTSATNFNQTNNMLIGADRSTTNFANGYISNLRLSNTNRTISITPTSPLSADANTIFLALNSNWFQYTDSTAAYTAMTVTGTPSVQAFSPFVPSGAYTTTAVGGSGYFDSSGDYLTSANAGAAANLGTTWTVECWLYPANLTSTSAIVNVNVNTGNQGINIYRNGATITVDNGVTGGTGPSGGTLIANAWQHLAVVADGTNTRIFLNGTQVGSTFAGTVTSGTPTHFWVGSSFTGLGAWGGYIANVRIVKGTAVYTGTFTPPIAPVTTSGPASSYSSTTNVNTTFTSTNTSLLLNFTNAGITDATAKNVLETVGNAQISTTQSKFGGSSIYFDGTGDVLTIPKRPYFDFPGDFTIEFWLYVNSLASYSFLMDTRSSISTFWLIDLTTAGVIGWGPDATIRISSSAITTGQWYHVAISRSGSSTRMFLNGTQTGSTYTSSALITAGTTSVVIGGSTSNTSNANVYMDDIRITTGYARYTANFTAPTAAFPVQ